MTELFFGELTSARLTELKNDDRDLVLLLPVGATEPHGPHGPLNTDPLISLGTCTRAVQALHEHPAVRALILPPVDYGVTRFAAGFDGALHIGEETLHALLTDICGSLIDRDLRHIVLVNNHFEPGQVATLRRVVDTVSVNRGVTIGFLDLVRRRRAQRLTEEFRSGSCHAGRYETSLVLADRPELVDTEAMTGLPALPVNMPEHMGAGKQGFLDMGMDRAYCGDPAAATAAEGESTYRVLTEMLLEVIHDVITHN
ncbi:creatininase family protein [Pseudonocardiaceae bacterium YIM PH 21723]|nr:creatininase family protein [Pseudonocardiaceae bacterium YIM PH 21723]